MTTREIILVSVAALAVLYGAGHLMTAPRRAAGAAGPSKGTGGAAGLAGPGVKQAMDVQSDLHVLKRLESEWAPDPFAAKPLKFGASPGSPDETKGYLYSGCVEAGGVSVAFINGLEYRVGEEVAPSGYVVESIDRANVVLRERTGQGKITVPICEEGVRKP